MCCGTKRLVEIACPTDCVWLASARDHPAAVVVRQQQRDLGLLVQFMRDFNRRQSQLFFLFNSFINEYQPEQLHALNDADVADAVDALAATYETAARGVIYEHRPQSLTAERLVLAMKPLLAEAGKGQGTPFERDAAVVLRSVGAAAREVAKQIPANPRAYVELLRRVMRSKQEPGRDAGASLIEGPKSKITV